MEIEQATTIPQNATTPTEAETGVVASKIPTANIKVSKRFAKYNRDLMSALLKEQSYTVEEAEKILDDFMGAK